METKITLEDKDIDASSMNFIGGEVEQNGKAFPFTVCEMYDANSGTYSFEITWCDETPENAKELEEQILNSPRFE